MLAGIDYLDLAELDREPTAISDDVEREITLLLRARGPDLSPQNRFRIAASLIDAAAATIVDLQGRVTALEAERDKLSTQEADWENLLNKWRDMAAALKLQIRDLEAKLAAANQRTMQAELRAQNAEEEIGLAQRGSLDLCDKLIATFGSSDLIAGARNDVQGVAGSC